MPYMVERWKPVPGRPGYEMSTLGMARSLPRAVQTVRGVWRYKGRTLHGYVNRSGYQIVRLGRERRPVHQLVAETFLGPRPPGCEVRHLDGNPTNNRVENLAWGTHTDNVGDTLRHGRNDRANRDRCPRRHPLVGANLIRGALVKGRRSCRACALARERLSRAQRRGEIADWRVSWQALSDRLFIELTGEPLP